MYVNSKWVPERELRPCMRKTLTFHFLVQNVLHNQFMNYHRCSWYVFQHIPCKQGLYRLINAMLCLHFWIKMMWPEAIQRFKQQCGHGWVASCFTRSIKYHLPVPSPIQSDPLHLVPKWPSMFSWLIPKTARSALMQKTMTPRSFQITVLSSMQIISDLN